MSGQDVVIAIISAVGGAVISWYISRHFHRLVHRPKLQITSQSIPLLSVLAPRRLKVTMGETNVPEPHLVEVVIRNGGTVDLRADAFDSNLPLGIRFRGFKATEVLDRGERTPQATLKGAEVEIGPARLPRGQSWSLTLLGSGQLVGQPVLRTAHLADTDIFDPETELARATKLNKASNILTWPGIVVLFGSFIGVVFARPLAVAIVLLVLAGIGMVAFIAGAICSTLVVRINDRIRGYRLPMFLQ